MVVEDPSQILVGGSDQVTEIEIDESIGWDSRKWELLWSDEFEAEAGAPISSASWTCEVGGHGWGNNELEFYSDRVENVAQ